jgi:hypothetical protein
MGQHKDRIPNIVTDRINVLKRFFKAGVEVTATAAELNTMDGITATTAELNTMDGITATVAELNIMDGVTATAAEINASADNQVEGATIAVGAEAGDVINVTVQLTDAAGADIAFRGAVPFYMSDDANGDSIAAAAASAGIAIGTDGLMIEWTANLAGLLVSEADGDIDIDIGEAGVATWYLIVVLPNGKLVASSAITFA